MVLPRFLAELKHRNVYRAAVVYAAVGWALLEASDVVLPRLGLPDWTVNLVLALVLLGFPLAIVFAWIFDVSARGIVRSEPMPPDIHHRFSFVRIAEFVLICVLVGTVGYLYVDRLSLQKRLVEPEIAGQETPAVPNPDQYRAIAVLPFADMSESGDQAWFAEGIAEELLHGLARVDELRVMARTSSFAFQGTDKTIAEIAEILNVQALLEGSVRRFGDRVRITTQLVDANSGFHIWSGSYERQLDDIFKLQDEIARSIVKTLRVELGVADEGTLISKQTENVEAYDWFLQGRALTTWANPEQIFQGINYFEKAVEVDPDYALAWGWLSYARVIALAFSSFKEVSPSIITAYEKALALNPDQGEALLSKALMTQTSQYEQAEAGLLYQKAIELADSAFPTMQYAFNYLIVIDKAPLAIRYMLEAERLDPLHAGVKSLFAMVLRVAGESEAAALKAREALQLNPEHGIALHNLIGAYVETRRFAAVEDLLRRIEPRLLKRPRTRLHVGLYHAARGDLGEARVIYRDLRNNLPPYPFPYLALLALRLGEVEEAIDLMEIEIDKGSIIQFWIRPMFQNEKAVKDHPRYLTLLKRIGLDDDSVAELHRKLSLD